VGSGRRNTIIFPFQFSAVCSPTATSIKGTFLFSLRRLPTKPHPFPQTFPNVTYPGILSRQVGEKKTIRFIAIPIPSNQTAILATDRTVNSEIGSLFS